MLRGIDLLGKLVVTYDTGKRIERVEDLIFDETRNQLLGFLVEEGGWFSSARVIPFHSISAMGPHAIVVPSRGTIVQAYKVPEVKQALKRHNILKGTRVMTTNGRDLGTIIDFYFNEQTGEIEGYEVSGGLFADAYSGRSFVPALHALKIGEDFAFVPPETAELMEEQVGGIRGAVQTAGGKVQETSRLAGQRLQEATQSAGEQLQTTTQKANESIQEAALRARTSLTNKIVTSSEQREFVIGKTVDQDIIAPDGTLLISKGQVVSSLTAAEAENLGMLDQLYRAAGGSITDVSIRQLQEGSQAAKANLATTAQLANTRIQEATRGSITSLTNTVIDPREQIAFVIGKTVDRDIIAPDGTQLIAQGEQVTPLVAEVAQSLGVLDQLYRAAGGTLTVGFAERGNAILASHYLEQTQGRRAQRAVHTSGGVFIAAPGQIVTESVIERARTYGREQELLAAVGLTPSQAAHSTASGLLARTDVRLREGTGQVQERVGTFWEQLKAEVKELQERSQQALEKQRIKRALGRPVTRAILGPQDNVILNVGELITHQAIEEARQGDVLDILLSSVYSRGPELSTQELRAPEQGEASLAKRDQVANGKESSEYQPMSRI